MATVGRVVWRDLHAVEGLLLDLAERHRSTVMVGRTHGQPGAPITFGFKAASWADEVRRHLDRLAEGRPRWLVAQLGGAVGVLGFFGDDGPAVRAAFCAELGLGDPGISWLTSRDRLAEFANVLAMMCATLARIGNEVYELQRPEIGELREATTAAAVGSDHHAPQAQPRAQRAPRHPGPPGAGIGRRAARRHGPACTSATGGAGRRSGSPSPRSACLPASPCRPGSRCCRGWRSTPRPWRPTSVPRPGRSGCWPPSPPGSGSTRPRSRMHDALRPGVGSPRVAGGRPGRAARRRGAGCTARRAGVGRRPGHGRRGGGPGPRRPAEEPDEWA